MNYTRPAADSQRPVPGADAPDRRQSTIPPDNAAGWGWFVDPTPHNDSEFTTPGNQGEQHRVDLLTVLEHEIGHLLGFDHSEPGASATGDVMADTLATGVRRVPGGQTDWRVTVDVVFAEDLFSGKKYRRQYR